MCIVGIQQLFDWFYVTVTTKAQSYPEIAWPQVLFHLAQATFRIAEPCLSAVRAYQTKCETQAEREEDLEARDAFLDTFEELVDFLEPHRSHPEDRAASPSEARCSYGWWKRTGCFWRKCLCHDARPLHHMKVCKGCGLATYCSEFCQDKYV